MANCDLIAYTYSTYYILVITNTVSLGQLWHKPYFGWRFNTFVKHCWKMLFWKTSCSSKYLSKNIITNNFTFSKSAPNQHI